MQNTKILIWTGIIVLAVALGLEIQQRRGHDTTQLETQVVRTYQVPPARADEVRSVLSRLFWQKDAETPVGNAQIFGSGILIVKAPIGFQNGIGNLVSKLSQDSAAAVHDRVRLDYWLVLGESGGKSNADAFGELSAALGSIDKIDGPRKFRVLEHLGTTSTTGVESAIKGSLAELKNVPRKGDDQFLLDFSVHTHGMGELTTKTVVKPGEFIVLGQNSLHVDADMQRELHGSAAWEQNPPNVYHVLRVEPQP